MRQITSTKWLVNLSPNARKKLEGWQIENDLFSEVDGEKIPFTQLSATNLLQYLTDNGSYTSDNFSVTTDEKSTHISFKGSDLITALENAVKEILEQKN